MESTDYIVLTLTILGLAAFSMRCWQNECKVKVKRKFNVQLTFSEALIPDIYSHCVILIFDAHGYLVRKLPESDIVKRKNKYKLNCSVQEGKLDFSVLLSSGVISLSGVTSSKDLKRILTGKSDVYWLESGLTEIKRNISLELFPSCQEGAIEKQQIKPLVALAEILPPMLVTDAMAKELTIELMNCSEPWEIGGVNYIDKNSDSWLVQRRENGKIKMELRTNFSVAEREAIISVDGAEQSYSVIVKQQAMGTYPALSVDRDFYVTSGQKNEIVSFAVMPESEDTNWRIKRINASDGGCWYSVSPTAGIHQKGRNTLKVCLEAKPVSVRSRSLILTLESGTYPFCQTMDILLMQGVSFSYYIEYPVDDVCVRHGDVIETPLGYRKTDPLKTYTICVNSNQPWRIIYDKKLDWLEIEEFPVMQGHYDGCFTIKVHSNEDNEVRNGFPAARYAILSLVNDTGIVRDIFIYQGGYVRIHGKCWLDRNLASCKELVPVAIPLGLENGNTLNHGGYFQFGKNANVWTMDYVPCKGNWYKGNAENPECSEHADPSPDGWRVPSHLEMEILSNIPVVPVELQRGEDGNNVCFLSDDGIPVYLPLCGHLSHINGCRTLIPHGNRYWTGSSQNIVYGYSLSVEPSRRMCILHDMKKCAFPVRSILAED
ncbi:hypothetical protein [Bacteroides cellulosilyticus]|uniref:hypothetical protein n=1 Tax=Bacteroides cellulosilyticus TaxID=246787 RepID=UPI0032BFCDEC